MLDLSSDGLISGKRASWFPCFVERRVLVPHMNRRQRHASHPLNSRYPNAREERLNTLPNKHFVNLTNGIETLKVVRDRLHVKDPMFLRLQSSLCERGAYEKILSETDHNFLTHVATGHNCYVYDLASRSKKYGVPRAIWYGLEFVRYACAFCWFGENSPQLPETVLLRGKNVARTWFNVMKHDVSKSARQRLKYYREFVTEMGVDDIRIYGIVGQPTKLDGCKDLHAKMIRDTYESGDYAQADLDETSFHRELERCGLRIYDSSSSFEENLKATAKISQRK
eukprot:Plantae.Rhodophyta-Purpureofilum_apyrenoidigerum.ctg3475.p2 GENE.Plantae.Rhodophyta-Purpureofilum_apyrenoidigerum.ctg3475~~Plantae.Rhodophyta-Purpureofilum_apyrenoidigerum.ctg3475.p2  ORF type:complete len:282 (-),score=43.49 Plantae.Rhodophyta-Purpureofilum_apyrenoidigerum.ctg3475:227-1072(-)